YTTTPRCDMTTGAETQPPSLFDQLHPFVQLRVLQHLDTRSLSHASATSKSLRQLCLELCRDIKVPSHATRQQLLGLQPSRLGRAYALHFRGAYSRLKPAAATPAAAAPAAAAAAPAAAPAAAAATASVVLSAGVDAADAAAVALPGYSDVDECLRSCWQHPQLTQLVISELGLQGPLAVSTLSALPSCWPGLRSLTLHDTRLSCPLDCTDPVALDTLLRSLYTMQGKALPHITLLRQQVQEHEARLDANLLVTLKVFEAVASLPCLADLTISSAFLHVHNKAVAALAAATSLSSLTLRLPAAWPWVTVHGLRLLPPSLSHLTLQSQRLVSTWSALAALTRASPSGEDGEEEDGGGWGDPPYAPPSHQPFQPLSHTQQLPSWLRHTYANRHRAPRAQQPAHHTGPGQGQGQGQGSQGQGHMQGRQPLAAVTRQAHSQVGQPEQAMTGLSTGTHSSNGFGRPGTIKEGGGGPFPGPRPRLRLSLEATFPPGALEPPPPGGRLPLLPALVALRLSSSCPEAPEPELDEHGVLVPAPPNPQELHERDMLQAALYAAPQLAELRLTNAGSLLTALLAAAAHQVPTQTLHVSCHSRVDCGPLLRARPCSRLHLSLKGLSASQLQELVQVAGQVSSPGLVVMVARLRRPLRLRVISCRLVSARGWAAAVVAARE
ncbi:hypothetical protein QJQ45_027391, partial [Haematococcus lacustris]